jgi:hypothetical protein
MAELRRMGIRAVISIYPPHASHNLLPPSAKFDVENARYVVEA